jgi:ribosomal protein S18 acetylase RimI-like enzyme
VIRRLTREDAAAYGALRLEALTLAPDAFGASPQDEADRDAAEVLARNAVFGAEGEDGLLGMAALWRETLAKRRHIGLVWGVWVALEARGQGLGQRLMAAVIAEARAQGLTYLQLGVGATNLPALALDRRAGFVVTGFEEAALCVDGAFLDELLMTLRLSPR